VHRRSKASTAIRAQLVRDRRPSVTEQHARPALPSRNLLSRRDMVSSGVSSFARRAHRPVINTKGAVHRKCCQLRCRRLGVCRLTTLAYLRRTSPPLASDNSSGGWPSCRGRCRRLDKAAFGDSDLSDAAVARCRESATPLAHFHRVIG